MSDSVAEDLVEDWENGTRADRIMLSGIIGSLGLMLGLMLLIVPEIVLATLGAIAFVLSLGWAVMTALTMLVNRSN